MTKKSILLLCVLLLHATFALGAQTEPRLESLIDDLYATNNFQQVAISPDGRHVAWVLNLHDKFGAPSSNTAIYVASLPASSAAPRRITAANDGNNYFEQILAWSPDGKQLAFFSDANGSGQSELYVAQIAGGPARKLTNLTGFLTDPQWSRDGKQIAFLFTENAPRTGGPLAAMTPEVGVLGSKVYEQRLTTVDLGSGSIRQLSPPDMYVYEYGWAPDSQSFALTAAHGEGDNNWYIAQLYTLGLSGEMKSIYKPPFQIAVPRWSPDGKSVAFVAGLMSDEGATGGDIFSVPAAGGSGARNLTPGIKASPNWLAWRSPGEILFTENLDGSAALATLDLGSGKISTLWTAPEEISTGAWGAFALSLARDGKSSAIIRQSFARPPEVWAGSVGGWQQVTHVNQQLRPTWGEAKNIHWMNDGMLVQGWLLYPTNYDPNRRYPMVVTVHGGPAFATAPAWPQTFFETSILASRGYFVFFPNPRGSYGQGEAFTRGNVKDFGYGDFRDILAGVDAVLKQAPVDPERLGITGWSYGGYMTMWSVTQTNRFRAAVSGAGLANWLSYYGENDIDGWMPPYFGASVYDDPAVYARSAPMTFVKRVKTPTLVLVGERDGECPMPQSREFWHALKMFGVPTEMVVYPNEGHFIANFEHQRDISRRMVAWFDKYLQPATVSQGGEPQVSKHNSGSFYEIFPLR